LSLRTAPFRLRIALIALIALLVAQFGAEAHAYSHVHAGAHSSDRFDSNGRLCSECSAFAPLLATADGPAHLHVIQPQGVLNAPAVAIASLISRLTTLAFRSRAPPLHP
jgi:hypothetical protein